MTSRCSHRAATFLFDVDGLPRRLARRPARRAAGRRRRRCRSSCRPRRSAVVPVRCVVAAAGATPPPCVPWTLYERYGDTELLAQSARQHAGLGRLRAGPRPATGCCGRRSSSSATGSIPTRRPTSRGARRPTGCSSRPRTSPIRRSSWAMRPRCSASDDVAQEYDDLARAVAPRSATSTSTASGLLSSDSVTAYCARDRLRPLRRPAHRARAAQRIAGSHSMARGYRISTGFVGTPVVLPALTGGGRHRRPPTGSSPRPRARRGCTP